MAEEMVGGYRLVKHMATGQTSQVWEVVEVASGRHFAMKLLLPAAMVQHHGRRIAGAIFRGIKKSPENKTS